MKIYTIEDQDKIGAQLADIFGMKKSREHKGRWNMGGGHLTKTNVGVFNTLLEIARKINEGEKL